MILQMSMGNLYSQARTPRNLHPLLLGVHHTFDWTSSRPPRSRGTLSTRLATMAAKEYQISIRHPNHESSIPCKVPCASISVTPNSYLAGMVDNLLSALSCLHRRNTRPLIPKSSYYFGPPPPDAAFGTQPVGKIGVHHPREVIRIERDYTGGELIQFASIYPLELEGRVRVAMSFMGDALTLKRFRSHQRSSWNLSIP